MKKIVRLTESDLHKIVKESVNRVMNEGFYNGDFWGDDNHGENPEEYVDPEDEEMNGPDELNKNNKDNIMQALYDALNKLYEAKQKVLDADSYAGRGVYRDRFYEINTKLEKVYEEFHKMLKNIYKDLNS